MRIRKFMVKDAAEVARMHRGTIKNVNSKDYSKKEIEVWAGRSSAKRMRGALDKINRYVAVEGRRIVCFGDFDGTGELGGFYVHKDYLSRGLGKKMLARLESEAYKKGLRELHLESTITAKDFYIKQGFKVIKKGKHKIADQRLTIFHMGKRLKPRCCDF
jgi:putative acetyltransferase